MAAFAAPCVTAPAPGPCAPSAPALARASPLAASARCPSIPPPSSARLSFAAALGGLPLSRLPAPQLSPARHAASRRTARAAADVQQLRGARDMIADIIRSKNCNPILIRLGWHDAGTYDCGIAEWPKAGGANGSIRFKPEINHGSNAGLAGAISLLEPVKEKFPAVSWADLFQLASATGAELAGSPKIPMRYGRLDAAGPEDCPPEGRLPSADPTNPAEHLREVFYRMGLDDKEIVALSGGHTLGRARPDRSGFGKESTKYTKEAGGGSSWTVEWLKFDNSYFKDIKAQTDSELLVLPTDAVLFTDPEFKKYAEKYAEDQDAFFADYAVAYKKLSELGAKFNPAEGVTLDKPAAIYVDDDDVYESKISDEMKERLRKEYLSFGGSPDQPLQSNPFLNIMFGVAIFAILAKLSGAF